MKLMHTLNLKDELKDKKNEIMKEILMHKKIIKHWIGM